MSVECRFMSVPHLTQTQFTLCVFISSVNMVEQRHPVNAAQYRT